VVSVDPHVHVPQAQVGPHVQLGLPQLFSEVVSMQAAYTPRRYMGKFDRWPVGCLGGEMLMAWPCRLHFAGPTLVRRDRMPASGRVSSG